MEDNIYTLKADIQQCIVNNMDLKNDYRVLLYDKNTINFLQVFSSFENLEIFPSGSLMRFQGKIAQDLKDQMNEDDINNIKRIVWQNNAATLIKQAKDSKKTAYQKENERIIAEMKLNQVLQECEDQEFEYRNATENEKITLKAIKRELDLIGLSLDYEEHEDLLMLSGNFEYLSFTKKELRYFVNLITKNNINNFLIAPSYSEEDEEDDECKSIRIVIAIDLAKEE